MTIIYLDGVPDIKAKINVFSISMPNECPTRRITGLIELNIGDSSIYFSGSGDEVAAFCEKHNFHINDRRTGVEKYLSRLAVSS